MPHACTLIVVLEQRRSIYTVPRGRPKVELMAKFPYLHNTPPHLLTAVSSSLDFFSRDLCYTGTVPKCIRPFTFPICHLQQRVHVTRSLAIRTIAPLPG